MIHVIYVVALSVAFDVVNIILFYLNRTALSHAVQTFTSTLKLRVKHSNLF